MIRELQAEEKQVEKPWVASEPTVSKKEKGGLEKSEQEGEW